MSREARRRLILQISLRKSALNSSAHLRKEICRYEMWCQKWPLYPASRTHTHTLMRTHTITHTRAHYAHTHTHIRTHTHTRTHTYTHTPSLSSLSLARSLSDPPLFLTHTKHSRTHPHTHTHTYRHTHTHTTRPLTTGDASSVAINEKNAEMPCITPANTGNTRITTGIATIDTMQASEGGGGVYRLVKCAVYFILTCTSATLSSRSHELHWYGQLQKICRTKKFIDISIYLHIYRVADPRTKICVSPPPHPTP